MTEPLPDIVERCNQAMHNAAYTAMWARRYRDGMGDEYARDVLLHGRENFLGLIAEKANDSAVEAERARALRAEFMAYPPAPLTAADRDLCVSSYLQCCTFAPGAEKRLLAYGLGYVIFFRDGPKEVAVLYPTSKGIDWIKGWGRFAPAAQQGAANGAR